MHSVLQRSQRAILDRLVIRGFHIIEVPTGREKRDLAALDTFGATTDMERVF